MEEKSIRQPLFLINFDSDINYMYPKGTSYGAPVAKFFAGLDFE
jgi:hypothetical protein